MLPTTINKKRLIMKEFTKLTVDETGKLHGGFMLGQGNEPEQTDLNNSNTNCGNNGKGDTNKNCFCDGCGLLPIEPNL